MRIEDLQAFDGLADAANRRATVSMLARAGFMRLRGAAYAPLLRACEGPLFVGRGARIKNPSFVTTRGRVVIEDFADVQGISSQGIILGADVSIGRATLIRPSSYYGGEVGVGFVMGDRSSIGARGFIGCSGFITLGCDVLLGPDVQVFSENHRFSSTDVAIKAQGVQRGVTVIEDDCWIGAGTVITSNVTIGRSSIVAAGSVVTRDVPPWSVAAGNPARIIRSRLADHRDDAKDS